MALQLQHYNKSMPILKKLSLFCQSSFDHPSIILRSSFVHPSIGDWRMIIGALENHRGRYYFSGVGSAAMGISSESGRR